ncbi:Gfo/Idh/MocA family oxidoreductase [Vibrio sp.]|uniref:Gfo/Idh/MocA family oxidoreductase n=1 Tax=Vibrio sp. TaxID=678 RepID=UPI003AA8D95F
MFNLAIIGTNWISQQFVEAAIQTRSFSLKAVYSREFTRDHLVRHTMQNFLRQFRRIGEDPDIDAVYIASPNSLMHLKQ